MEADSRMVVDRGWEWRKGELFSENSISVMLDE